MASHKTSILDWTVNKTPKEKYQLKFRLENLPGVGTMEMVAGECLADSPVAAGKTMEINLKNRIGKSKFGYLAEAKVVDDAGKDRAYLQIHRSSVNTPVWGNWLKVF